MAQLVDLVSPALVEGQVEAIHDARVATRRLSAALRLLRPVLSQRQRRPMAKLLRKLRRRLRRLRDLDVMISHLEDWKVGRDAAAVAWLLPRLRERRQRRLAKSSQKTDARELQAKLGRWWGLRDEISGGAEAIGDCLAESVRSQLEQFARQANALLDGPIGPCATGDLPARASEERGSGSLSGALAGKVPGAQATPHTLRIAGKALRYTLEIAKVEGHQLPAAILRTFKRMQDMLGLWHDYIVLAQTVMELSLEDGLAYRDPAMQRQTLSLSQAILRRAESQWQAFHRLWQARHVEVERVLGELFHDADPGDLPAREDARATGGQAAGDEAREGALAGKLPVAEADEAPAGKLPVAPSESPDGLN